ncbi:MAG: universal stress protein, partial [Candidatus Sericytochromatia bacterium]|nr:universal stress protein [Candidatus Sericytochromatia bacterium]
YLKNGPAGFMITRTVENESCDLVIMASRGLGTIKSFLIGSVTTYVLHHVKVPVFLIS